MYRAYQSGQFSSALPMRFSCSPWAAAARRSALARSLRTERHPGGSTRPGSRAVTSCKSQVLPSGSLNGGERGVAGGRARAATRPGAVGRNPPGASEMEHLADLDAAAHQLVARSLDVGDDQVQVLGRAGRGRREVRAELERARRARRGELDHPEAVVEGEVGVEPPPEARIELLRAVEVRDRNDDRLELQVDLRGARWCAVATCGRDLRWFHSGLLCLVVAVVTWLDPVGRQTERGRGGGSEDEVRAQVLPERLEVVLSRSACRRRVVGPERRIRRPRPRRRTGLRTTPWLAPAISAAYAASRPSS